MSGPSCRIMYTSPLHRWLSSWEGRNLARYPGSKVNLVCLFTEGHHFAVVRRIDTLSKKGPFTLGPHRGSSGPQPPNFRSEIVPVGPVQHSNQRPRTTAGGNGRRVANGQTARASSQTAPSSHLAQHLILSFYGDEGSVIEEQSQLPLAPARSATVLSTLA